MSPDRTQQKPTKRSVAVVVRQPDDPARVLTVLRPADDDELPSTWGLPAATLRPGESWRSAAARAGREKLGVTLRVGRTVGEDRTERESYVLRMRAFEAEIEDGEPEVPQPVRGVTRYRAWTWADADRLVPAARRGSLCSRIYLASVGREW